MENEEVANNTGGWTGTACPIHVQGSPEVEKGPSKHVTPQSRPSSCIIHSRASPSPSHLSLSPSYRVSHHLRLMQFKSCSVAFATLHAGTAETEQSKIHQAGAALHGALG